MCLPMIRSCTVTASVTKCHVVQPERCLAKVSHWMSANHLKLNPDKTELPWTGSKYSQLSLGSRGLSLQIDSDIVTASDDVRVLGVIFSSDLNLDKQTYLQRLCSMFLLASSTSTSSTSLDDESTKTLVYAFVTARVDYCNTVLAGASRSVTDRLQRVLSTVSQVRPWTVAAATYRLALARCGRLADLRCGRSSSVQARHHSPPESVQQGAKVPHILLCRCLGYRWSSETALSTPSPAG